VNRNRIGVTANFRAAAICGIGVVVVMMLWGVGCGRTEYSQFPPNAEGLSLAAMKPPPGDSTRLLRNAHYLKIMGRPEMALRELEAAYQQDPGNIRVLNALALACDEMGEYTRAQKLYQEALALDVSNQALNNNLCFSYYLAGQWDQAEACFRQALTRNPQNIMARNNLGLLLCRRGRTEEARRLWQEAEGEVVAQKKMQQVMVALGGVDTSTYAKLPPSPPVAATPSPAPMAATPPPASVAATPPPASLNPSTAATPEPTPDKASLPVVPASAPQPPAAVPAIVPTAVPAAAPVAPPAAPPAKAREPVKIAADSAPPVQPVKESPVSAAAAKPAPAPEPTLAAKSPSEPITPKPVAQTVPVVDQKKPETPVAAAAPAQAKSPPAPPVKTAAVDKKNVAATAPPTPPPAAKAKSSAAASPERLTPEKLAQDGIEVLNGTGEFNLARQVRSKLKEDGFKVVGIGNYRNFADQNTIIYYRPGSEAVARALSAKYPKSRLEAGEKIYKGANIRIVLGKDAVKPSAVAADPGPAAEKIAAGMSATHQEPKPKTAAASAPAPPAAQAKSPAPPPVEAKAAAPAKAPAAAQAKASAPAAAQAKATVPATPSVSPLLATPHPYLTATELGENGIDIRNGTPAPDLARKTRSMLSQEGFNVVNIGNHIDFGAEKTIIYYRPGSEKVARNLKTKFFSNSSLEQNAKLPEDVAVKVLLGKDLLQRREIMAKLDD